MIIRTTFNDNDFTSVLESFFENPLFMGLSYCVEKLRKDDSYESVKKFCNVSTEVDDFLKMIQDEKNFTNEQENRFLQILRESLEDYIKDFHANDAEYLIKKLKISLKKSVKDKWENGEVVYYFPMHDKFVTM